MKGTRHDLHDNGILEPGEYGLISGIWFACTPNGLTARLYAHQVIEHDNGIITVSPSIFVKKYNGQEWHGYLERGVWREV